MPAVTALILCAESDLMIADGLLGQSSTTLANDSEAEDYIELLSASSMPFAVKTPAQFQPDTLVVDGKLQCSCLIITVAEQRLSAEQIDAIEYASQHFGMTLISSYKNPGERLSSLFGISPNRSTGVKFPCTITVASSHYADLDIQREFSLGHGWKIPLQPYGFRRQPVRYIKKHLRLLLEQTLAFSRFSIDDTVEVIAALTNTDHPLVTRFTYGKASNYYIGLSSDKYLNLHTPLHQLLRRIILENSGYPAVYTNMDDVMALRMDDPGNGERVYLSSYDAEVLTRQEWQQLLEYLQSIKARLSVMYVPAFLDDANTDNGRLYVDQQEVHERKAGTLYPSHRVRFEKPHTGRVYDYADEFEQLQNGAAKGLLELESHGLTHITPNIAKWLEASDRYTNMDWFREFRCAAEGIEASDESQRHTLSESIRLLEEYFSRAPMVVTPSGHEQSENSETIAHHLGFKLFSGDYHSYQSDDFLIRNDKINAQFFEVSTASDCYRQSGYPVVGVFHDYNLKEHSLTWLQENLADWADKGKTRLMSLQELSGYLNSKLQLDWIENAINVSVDISNTTNVHNTPGSSFFADAVFACSVVLPRDHVHKQVMLGSQVLEDVSFDPARHELTISLPAFGEKTEQQFSIQLESS